MTAGVLCSGIGGLELALEQMGHRIAWHAEVDEAPASVHAQHWPGLPNLGDITAVEEPVDTIAAGYPCQPFSTAGRRQGTDDDRHLWPAVRDAVAHLRPRRVLLENVAGHVSLGLGSVLLDLAALGFDAEWGVLGSDAVGGCHRRHRLWILAMHTDSERRSSGGGLTRSRAADAVVASTLGVGSGSDDASAGLTLLPTPAAADGSGATRGGSSTERQYELHGLPDFGRYQAAVDRWAAIHGTPPAPTDERGRLHPPFVEWMMGYPAGWVTGRGLSRSAELKALGNAVQPQTAVAAFTALDRRRSAVSGVAA